MCRNRRARREIGRRERIRTSDPFVPNEVRYQAALHADFAGAIIPESIFNTSTFHGQKAFPAAFAGLPFGALWNRQSRLASRARAKA